MKTMMFQPSSGSSSLVVLENGGIQCYDLDSRVQWTIGRVTSSHVPDIQLTSPIASRAHGEFMLVDSEWFYLHRSKTNGTLYNGVKIKSGLNGQIRPVLLKNGDILRIDQSGVGKADPRGVWMLFSTERIPGKWTYYSLSKQNTTVIGRDSNKCDLVQPLAYVSAQHTKITNIDGKYYVSDCGSMAGTCLNGLEVYKPVCLKEKIGFQFVIASLYLLGLG